MSVTLTPSHDLHTRRGTLIGVNGNPDATISTLSTLNPIRRALVGIPFLYQRITSTEPISLLISPTRHASSPDTSLAILHLDGTTDWRLAQRRALVAWTGKTLNVTPTINTRLTLAHWGTSDATGRGLLALAGQGHIYSIELGPNESYVAHPSNILAYSTNTTTTTTTPLPQPYRFKSTTAKFTIPLQLGNWFPDSRYIRALKTSNTYKFFQSIVLRIKTWSRRTLWGDRLFLRFEGPTTILIQSRASRVSEVLSREDVMEIGDAPAGLVQQTIRRARIAQEDGPSRSAAAAVVSAPTIVAAQTQTEQDNLHEKHTEEQKKREEGIKPPTKSDKLNFEAGMKGGDHAV